MSAPPQPETPQLIYDPESTHCWSSWRYVLPYMSTSLVVGFLARNLRINLRKACFVMGRGGGLINNLRVVAEAQLPWSPRLPESDAVWKSASKPLEQEVRYRDFKQLQVHGKSQQEQDAAIADVLRRSLDTFEDIMVEVDKLLAEHGVKLAPDAKGRFQKEQDIRQFLNGQILDLPLECDLCETWYYDDEKNGFIRAKAAGVSAVRENAQQQNHFYAKITDRAVPEIPLHAADAPRGLLEQVKAAQIIYYLIPCCAKCIGYFRDLQRAAQQFADAFPELYRGEETHSGNNDGSVFSADQADESGDDEVNSADDDSSDSDSEESEKAENPTHPTPFRRAVDAVDVKTSMRLAPLLLDDTSNLRKSLQSLSFCAMEVLAALNAHGWY